MSEIDVNEFLNRSGVPAAKFDDYGDSAAGEILEARVEQQKDFDNGTPKHWDDGSPMLQIVLRVQTDQRDPAIENDNGQRMIYARSHMFKALQTAVRAASARLEPGGMITVTYYSDGEQKKRGLNPPKLYKVQYSPAEQTAVDKALQTAGATGITGDELARPAGIAPSLWETFTAEQKAKAGAVQPGF